MRAVVIYAVLIAWALDAGPASAQSGGDQTREVMPWALRTEENVYGYQPDTGSGTDYQWTTYQSLTVQANRYLWMHLGFGATETQLPGLSQPYQDNGSLKLAVVAQVLPDLLYVLAAGNYAFGHTALPLSDSLSLSDNLNGYSPLPDPGFLSVPSGLLGALLHLPLFAGHADLGVNYDRPGKMSVFDTLAFTPASFVSFQARYRIEADGVDYDGSVRLFLFTGEQTSQNSVAHQEGPLLEGEYAVKGTGPRHSLDAGFGAAWKWIDQNRLKMLNVPPVDAPDNDNLQKLWGDLRWRPWQNRTRLWTGLRLQGLYALAGDDFGYEARWECGWEHMLGKAHPLEITGYLLSSSFADVAYRGAGMQISFSFRHLGWPPDAGP